jgi:Ca2+-binding EF-hand superfamily protein
MNYNLLVKLNKLEKKMSDKEEPKLTEQQKKTALEQFKKYDKDNSGTIDINELKLLCEDTLKTKMSDKVIKIK